MTTLFSSTSFLRCWILFLSISTAHLLPAQSFPSGIEKQKAKIDCSVLTPKIHTDLTASLLNTDYPITFNGVLSGDMIRQLSIQEKDKNTHLTQWRDDKEKLLKCELRSQLSGFSTEVKENVAVMILTTQYYLEDGAVLVEMISYVEGIQHDNSDIGWILFDNQGKATKISMNGNMVDEDKMADMAAFTNAAYWGAKALLDR